LKNYASFSTYNDKVDMVAPGVDVWSAIPMNFDCLICQELVSSAYASLDGTSQAAPHVAAAAALLWSYNISAPVDYIYNALLASAADLGLPGRDDYHGHGLVQVRDALDVLKSTLSGEEKVQNWTVPDPLPEGYDIVTCSGTELLVTVNLLTDRYGNETSWTVVRNVDEFTVMSAAGFASRQTYSKSYCLPPNCYTFEIRDASGDGISGGEYGNGKFDVMVDGRKIFSGGNFTFFDRASFGGDCVALAADPKPVLPSSVEVKLVLFTDAYPFETLVSLEDLQTGEIFWTEEIFDEEETEYILTQEIDPAGCYNFVITDSGGDGICCLYGFGYSALFIDDISVFTLDGDFGSRTSYLVGDSCSDQI
jgi:Subtilase family